MGHVFSAFNAHALGALAEVAGPGLNFHLGTILPALLAAMGSDDMVCCLFSLVTFFLGAFTLLSVNVNFGVCYIYSDFVSLCFD